MKKLFAFLLFGFMFLGLSAQEKSDLPNITLKNLDGESVNIADLNNNGKPFIIAFWATWCSPGTKQFNAWSEVYDEWVEETGVKIFIVSIDNERSSNKVGPMVTGRGWPFEVILDPKLEFNNAMNVSNTPHYFLFNGEGKIVFNKVGYIDEDEEELYDELIKIRK